MICHSLFIAKVELHLFWVPIYYIPVEMVVPICTTAYKTEPHGCHSYFVLTITIAPTLPLMIKTTPHFYYFDIQSAPSPSPAKFFNNIFSFNNIRGQLPPYRGQPPLSFLNNISVPVSIKNSLCFLYSHTTIHFWQQMYGLSTHQAILQHCWVYCHSIQFRRYLPGVSVRSCKVKAQFYKTAPTSDYRQNWDHLYLLLILFSPHLYACAPRTFRQCVTLVNQYWSMTCLPTLVSLLPTQTLK